MGYYANTITQGQRHPKVLQLLVGVSYPDKDITNSVVAGLPGLKDIVDRFDAGKFVTDAVKAKELVKISNGDRAATYRLNLESRGVIKAALAAKCIVNKEEAEKLAEKLHDDPDQFELVCLELQEVSADWFVVTECADRLRKFLNLDSVRWHNESLGFLLASLRQRGKTFIAARSVSTGGQAYKITLPSAAPKVDADDDDDDDTDDEASSSAGSSDSNGNDTDADGETQEVEEEGTNTEGSEEPAESAVTLPSPKGRSSKELARDPAIRIFFLSFIGMVGPRNWARTMALRVAIMRRAGWENVARTVTGGILSQLEEEGLLKKRGENKGREYQLTEKGRAALSKLASKAETPPTAPPVEATRPPVISVRKLPEPSLEEPPASKPAKIELPSRSEVEAELRQVRGDLEQKANRRREIAGEIVTLREQIQVLEREHAELLAAEGCQEPVRVRLEGLLAEIQAAEEAKRLELQAKADALFAETDPEVLKLLVAKALSKG